MSISEAVRPSNVTAFRAPLAWPIIGGKGIASDNGAAADDDVRALQRIGTKSRIARNETIFFEGDPAENAYKVVSGVVRLCKHMAGGRRHIAQFSYPGDFFSVLDVEQHCFTAEAVTDVVLMCYPQRQLAVLGEERPSVRSRFVTLLSQRLCEMQDHLTVLGRQTAKERVTSFLLSLAERVGVDEDDLIDAPMTRLDMADYLGLTNETVCRVISELRRSGLIESPNFRQFILSDVDALQAVADGEEEAPWEQRRLAA
jgi:CRP-like cAMP-binding protein